MKKEQRKIFIIIAIIVIVLIIVILILKKSPQIAQEQENKVIEENVDILENGTKLNNSEQLSKTKMLDEMEISKIQLTHQNGKTVLLATATNTTNKATELTPIKIILYDKNQNIIGEVKGLISPIKPKETTQLNIGIQEDYANAYDFRIEKR